MKHDLNRNLQWRAKRLYALFACLVLTLLWHKYLMAITTL